MGVVSSNMTMLSLNENYVNHILSTVTTSLSIWLHMRQCLIIIVVPMSFCTCVLHSIRKPNEGIFPGTNVFYPSKGQKIKWCCGRSSPYYNSTSFPPPPLICQTSVDTLNKPETTGYFSFHNISTFQISQTLSRFKILNCLVKEVI